MGILLMLVAAAVAAPLLAPYSPSEIHDKSLLSSPSPEFWFGTDQLGRDLFSRLLHGGRVSLRISLLSVLLGTVLGGLLGAGSGYFRGKLDMLGQRFVDILLAFPPLVLAMLIVVVIPPSELSVVVAIGATILPYGTRVIRSVVLTIRETEYVQAARAIGSAEHSILLRHVLPNTLAPWIVLMSIAASQAIITEATLGFLGLGVPAYIPTWGGALSAEARLYVETAPWLAIAPGLLITVTALCFNLLGDTLRDLLDPRLQHR